MNPRFMGKNNSWRSKLDYKPHYTIQPIKTHSHAKVQCYIYPPRTHKGIFSKNSKFKFEVCTVCSQVWSTASQSRKESYFRIQLRPKSRLKISHQTWGISAWPPWLLGSFWIIILSSQNAQLRSAHLQRSAKSFIKAQNSTGPEEVKTRSEEMWMTEASHSRAAQSAGSPGEQGPCLRSRLHFPGNRTQSRGAHFRKGLLKAWKM